MERLNDIISRTAQRRRQESDHRSTYHTPSQGMRAGATPPRRPLPEQTARLGQPSRVPNVPQPGGQRTLPPGARSGQSDPNTYAQRPIYNQQRVQANRPTGEKLPERGGWSPGRSTPSTRADAHHPRVQADVQHESQGEWDDDTANIRYGDWENDVYDERMRPQVPTSTHAITHSSTHPISPMNGAAARSAQTYTGNRSMATRELHPLSEEEANLPMTYNARDSRLPVALPSHLSLPGRQRIERIETRSTLRGPLPTPDAAESPYNPTPQEVRQTYRVTQPLNRPMGRGQAQGPHSHPEPPLVPTRMSQDMPQDASHMQRMSQDMPQDAARMQKPAHQSAGQEALGDRATSRAGRDDPTIQLIPAPYHAKTTICPICKGAGYLRADVPYGHPNFGKPIACKCKEAERFTRRHRQLQEISNLGELKEKSFKNFRPGASKAVENAYYEALEYAEDPKGWLIFIGRVGCGKTHLAAAIANQSLAHGSLVLFSTVIDLLDHLRTAFSPTATEVYDQKLSKMREAELLVLDDLGAQQSTPWATEKLFQLLNYRYNYRMPTVITTNNLGLQGIDERIRSRLMDVSLAKIVTIDKTVDFRPQNPWRG